MEIVIAFLPLLSLWIFIALVRYMLLNPIEPVSVLGWRMQGILPACRSSITKAIAGKAAQEFASMPGLEDKLSNPANFDKLKPAIEAHMDDFLNNRLKEQMPMISMFIGEKTINSLKTIFIAEIEKLFPQVIGQFAGNLQKELPIGRMIEDKLNAIPNATLAENVKKAIAKPFSQLYLLATVLGGLMAALIWFLL